MMPLIEYEENLVLSESLRVKVDDLRNSLRGEADDDADRLLVDHIVVAWLEMQYTRMAAIQPQQHIRDARFWDDRYERANARYLAAIRELITVRELLGHGDIKMTLRYAHLAPHVKAEAVEVLAKVRR